MRQFLLIILLISCCSVVTAQKTTRKGLKTQQPEKSGIVVTAVVDTLFHLDSDIVISGYEKPLLSRKESFHLTNNTTADIVETIADITYKDYKGQELHKRKVSIKAEVPSKSTRLLSFPSWDIQNRFYYAGGPVPRREAYPYDVEIEITAVIQNIE